MLLINCLVSVAQTDLSGDEAAVLGAWLSKRASLTNKTPILLNQKTSVALLHVVESFAKFGERLLEQVADRPSELQLAVADFLEKNKSSSFVQIDTNTFPQGVVIIPDDESGIEWNKIKKEHPKSGGILSVSRVGIDPSKRFAVMFVEDLAGPLSVFAEFVVLERKDGLWKMTKISVGPKMYG